MLISILQNSGFVDYIIGKPKDSFKEVWVDARTSNMKNSNNSNPPKFLISFESKELLSRGSDGCFNSHGRGLQYSCELYYNACHVHNIYYLSLALLFQSSIHYPSMYHMLAMGCSLISRLYDPRMLDGVILLRTITTNYQWWTHCSPAKCKIRASHVS